MRTRRSIALTVLVPTILTLAAIPASAHYLSTGWVDNVNTGNFCMGQLSLLSHSSTHPKGQFRGGAQTTTDIYGFNCKYVGGKQATIKDLAVDVYVFKSGVWALCSQKTDASFHRANLWRFEHDHWDAPCGAAYYTVGSESYAWWNNQWWGGYLALWEGPGCPNCTWYHWL